MKGVVEMGVRAVQGGTVEPGSLKPRQDHSPRDQDIPPEAVQNSAKTQLTPALEKLSKTAPVFDFRFHFKIHEETNRIMVQVIDQETGEILNEIPPEKILDLVARIYELVGLLLDKHA